MINRIRRAKQVLHEEGFLALSKQFLLFLKHLLFSYSSHNILESTLDPPDVTCQVKDLTLRMITSLEELDRLESNQLVGEGFNFPRYKELLSMEAILFGAFAGKELAHVCSVFIGRRAHESHPFYFAMQSGHTVGVAAFTGPKYRRKGIHLYTRSKALQYLREKGISRAWDIQNKDNIAARDSLVKLGYYLWGEGCRLRLLSLLTIEWTKPKSRLAPRRIRCSLNMNWLRIQLNRLGVVFKHPGVMLFALMQPSGLMKLLRKQQAPVVLWERYLETRSLRKASWKFSKFDSRWHSLNLAITKGIMEREFKLGTYGFCSGLYAICRIQKPEIVLETGVSAGHSSAHILQALCDNGQGRLFSIDLPNVSYVGSNGELHYSASHVRDDGQLVCPRVMPLGSMTGFVVPDDIKKRWELIIGRSSEVLPKLLERLGIVDIFLHDSEHTYSNMMFEFTSVWPYLRSGGWLLSHDVHCNTAFVDFCTRYGAKYAIVCNDFGLAQKSAN